MKGKKARDAIEPTGQGGKYSDIALTSLFNAHINTINAEKQLIWMRYSAMLVANAIVFDVLARMEFRSITSLFACIFGLALSVAWLILTKIGWKYAEKRIEEAGRFQWEGYANPAPLILEWLKASNTRDWIKVIAIAIVYLLIGAYVATGVFVLLNLC